MPIDFARRMKGAVTQTLVKSLLEDAGYRVVPLGIEEVIRELSSIDQPQYLNLNLPQSLRSLPDFLVADTSITRTWLVEVKYRRRWDSAAIESLRAKLTEQALPWGPLFLLLFLGEHSGGIDTPANRCGIFQIKNEAGNLLYKSPYAPHDWYPWQNAEWRFTSRLTTIFDMLTGRVGDRTIQKCCEFAAAYPDILDGA